MKYFSAFIGTVGASSFVWFTSQFQRNNGHAFNMMLVTGMSGSLFLMSRFILYPNKSHDEDDDATILSVIGNTWLISSMIGLAYINDR